MIKKIVSMVVVFVGVNVFASTPVNKGSAFPSSPPNQKEAYIKYKKNNNPARTLEGRSTGAVAGVAPVAPVLQVRNQS